MSGMRRRKFITLPRRRGRMAICGAGQPDVRLEPRRMDLISHD
jgi:hypothetical protein